MTTPSGLWTYPLAAGDYQDAGKLPSTDFNNYLDGLREIDDALVRAGAFSWTEYTLEGSHVPEAAAFDSVAGTLIVVGAEAGAAAVDLLGPPEESKSYDPTAGVITKLQAIASAAGTTVTGGTVSGATTARYRVSTDGGLTWSTGTSSYSANDDVQALAWTGSAFVSAVATGSGAADIETSPDGLVWTARTNPDANSQWQKQNEGGIATDGAGKVALLPSGTMNSITVSDDNGATWTSEVLPSVGSVWQSVSYTPAHGWVAYDSSGRNLAVSDDGHTWATTALNPPPNSWTGYGMFAIGNVYVCCSRNFANTTNSISISLDGCSNWIDVGSSLWNPVIDCVVSGGRIFWFEPAASTVRVTDRGII